MIWGAFVGLLLAVACGGKTIVDGGERSVFDDDVLGQGGDDLTEDCRDCIKKVGDSACDDLLEQCRNDEACNKYLKCQKHCGWAFVCEHACSTQFPDGQAAFSALPECFVCDQCASDCAQWWVHREHCGGN